MPLLGVSVRPGHFIKDYLATQGEASISEIHRAYKERVRELGPRGIRVMTYESFGKYFRHFVRLELIQFTGREEEIEYPPTGVTLLSIRNGEVVRSRKRYYALTPTGQTEIAAWDNPIKALYP